MGHGLFDREGQAHAALGVGAQFLELALATPAGVNLRFHNIQRAGQRPRGWLDLIDRGDGDALCDRCAKALQDLFALIFVDVHGETAAIAGKDWPRL